MIARPCRYCGFVASRFSDEDCPERNSLRNRLRRVRAWWSDLAIRLMYPELFRS